MTIQEEIDVNLSRNLGDGTYEGVMGANFTHEQAKQVLFNLRLDQTELAMFLLRSHQQPKHGKSELGTAFRVFTVFLAIRATHGTGWVEPFLSTLRREEVIQTLLLLEASTNLAASAVEQSFRSGFYKSQGTFTADGLNDDAVRQFACSGQAWTNCLFLAEAYKAGVVERLVKEDVADIVGKTLAS